MWSYNYNYLSHGLVGRGQEWKDHKYIDKVKTKSGGYRYIYNTSENKRQINKNSSNNLTQNKSNNIGNKNIVRGSGVLVTYFNLPKAIGLYTYDLKSGEKIKKAKNSLKKENRQGDLDRYDDIYSVKELSNYIKDFFSKYYYKLYGVSDIEQAWKDDVKAMKEYLISYYKTLPWTFSDFSDEEIVCLFMQMEMLEEGYDINEITLSHYLQSRGFIDEEIVQTENHIEMNDLNKLKNPMNDDKDMEVINWDNMYEMSTDKSSTADYLPGSGFGYSNNCAYCTLAYELRQRGYDVEASSVCWNTENTKEEIASWYIDEKTGKEVKLNYLVNKSVNSLTWKDDIKKGLLKDVDSSNNARGQFLVLWYGGGGHSVVYEVNNGDITIRDCQINKKYTLDKWLYENSGYISDAFSIRTDDKKISKDALKGVRNRGL